MLEILRDPLWQFIGAVLAIAALLVSIWVYVRQRQRKRLIVHTDRRIPLVALGRSGIPGLEVTYAGRRVENASIYLVTVQNIGNTPIIAADFETPLSLRFENSSRVLNVEIVDKTPSDLPVEAVADGSIATISRQLLNPGDQFTTRILVENAQSKPIPTARIAGVQKLESETQTSVVAPVLVLVGVVLVIVMYFSPRPRSGWISEIRADEIPFAIAGVVGIVLMTFGSLRLLFGSRSRVRDRFHD